MEESWLIGPVDPSEYLGIEQNHLSYVDSDDLIEVHGGDLPFGEHYFTWRAMRRKAELSQHFKIYRFDNNGWGTLAGRRGYVLVHEARDGHRAITGLSILTVMS